MESAQSSGKGEVWLDEETKGNNTNEFQVGREILWVRLGWQLALASALADYLVPSRYKSSSWGNFPQHGQEGL